MSAGHRSSPKRRAFIRLRREPASANCSALFPLLLATFWLSACGFLLGEPAQTRPEPKPEQPAPSASFAAPEAPTPVASSESPAPIAAQPESVMLPGVQPTGGQTRGRLPKAAVVAGIEQGNQAFEDCYLKSARPGLRGVIVVNFVVTPEGDVPHAAALEQGTDFPDDRVIECVLSAFKKLHFQAPDGGRAVITYPLKFEPTEPQQH
jgi:outer membrane biosynthesis protein TonB